jgi:nucleotide-binding universal stress UspA family protein
MRLFRRILVATDFGEASDEALRLAVAMARSSEAELVVLHVCEVPAYAYVDMAAATVDLVTPLADIAQKKLDELVASLRAQVPRARGVLKLGVPWEQILATVSEVSADLVVMGTHGRRGAAHALLGSVAEKIVRMCPSPVLTARPPLAATTA